ncbi:MAG: type II toxin-antitoxin system RelE/ParE family toxin [Paraburkholderia sp.]|nr:MAG: type II toxin-antitoxin system RelE/ParE family toxin [Paraburkholderia sp.]
MPYSLEFLESAAKEWAKLGADLKRQFAKKLDERLENPRVQHDALRRMKDCYRIKLRAKGYRLVYRVEDETITVLVLAVGKREKNDVYDDAQERQNARAIATRV